MTTITVHKAQAIQTHSADEPTQLDLDRTALSNKLAADEASQRRIKIITIIAISILVVGGATGVGLAVGIVPYCLLHTLLVCGGTTAGTLGFMGAMGYKVGVFDKLFERNSLPVAAKKELLASLRSRATRIVITDSQTWEYCMNFHAQKNKPGKKSHNEGTTS